METSPKSIRRIKDESHHDPEGDMRQMFNLMPALQSSPGVDIAGREVMYQDLVRTGMDVYARVSVRFRLQMFFFPVWITTYSGEDEEGPYEKGYEIYFSAYLPMPYSTQVGDDHGLVDVRWLRDLARHDRGIDLVPMSPEMKKKMTDSWSDPVRVRVNSETGELELKAMRHPRSGDEIDPMDAIWLDT